MRTYSRQAWEEARALWADFGWQWTTIRQLAAQRGMIYPPTGSAHDDRDAESPSQRAIIWRALEENPTELRAFVGRSSSWSDVVDKIIGLEARLREDAGYSEKGAAFDKERFDRDAPMSIKAILQRISDS